MAGNKIDNKVKKIIGSAMTSGASSMTVTPGDIMRKLATKLGAYTTTADKKEAAREKVKSQEAAALVEQQSLDAEEENRKKRNSIFQSAGGTTAVGGRSRIYGN